MKTRTAKETKVFKVDGTFESLYAAQKWCFENGYSYGSLCRNEPVALMKGDYNIAKWKNLTDKERATTDGVMLSIDFRESEVTIIIYKVRLWITTHN